MCFRSIQSYCIVLPMVRTAHAVQVVIPMCFRSIQRDVRAFSKKAKNYAGRNPYVFQVNSKRVYACVQEASPCPCGRNPYVFQVNSKPMSIALNINLIDSES